MVLVRGLVVLVPLQNGEVPSIASTAASISAHYGKAASGAAVFDRCYEKLVTKVALSSS